VGNARPGLKPLFPDRVRETDMKWTGFVVLLIVPAAFVMICLAVFLESSGIMGAIRLFLARAGRIFKSSSGARDHIDKNQGRARRM
jgi:hypothetical protein